MFASSKMRGTKSNNKQCFPVNGNEMVELITQVWKENSNENQENVQERSHYLNILNFVSTFSEENHEEVL